MAGRNVDAALLSVMTLFRKTVYFHLVGYLDGLGFALFFYCFITFICVHVYCVGILEIIGQLCCLVYPRDQTQFSHIANLYPLTGLTGSSFILFASVCLLVGWFCSAGD